MDKRRKKSTKLKGEREKSKTRGNKEIQSAKTHKA